MARIKFTQNALDYLKRRGILDKPLLLICDDAGGKYSIRGGSCSMGMSYSIIWLDHPDKDYPRVLENDEGVEMYTSDYDLAMLQDNLHLDYKNAALELKNDGAMLDGGVLIGNGPQLLAGNKDVHLKKVYDC
ncbi:MULTISPECIES: iron-sulfur cluster biosynthesis family protein [Lactobacillus]|uniref:Iron-sulfur cluster biosynthesis family protein n=1 Tax=Lactobacillus xujianguonis TaxID=2495899 RepID=A0A437SVQ8_9LACO|nr:MULTISPECIES: iron-sulfur cluster biosynthesis family protein [Lactobacillus]RVU71014.1 iron-sulfur cluster biosynthesis family protein [Lactobacillus xujianguonis]RVU73916.1 iron-sulfur cluster biosynthesis family protein [Lactobacillus xujianguonis]